MRLVAALVSAIGLLTACDDGPTRANNYCPPKLGCVNERLKTEVAARCPRAEQPCKVPLAQLVGDFDRAYVVRYFSVHWEACPTFRFRTEKEKRAMDELCDYVLFEKAGVITHHLRGQCLSDLHMRHDLFGPYPSDDQRALLLDASTEVITTWHEEKDPEGSAFRAHQLELARDLEAKEFDPPYDQCPRP
jgi:hypothetical protein